MFRKWFYGIVSALILIGLFLLDIVTIIPISSNQFIVSMVILTFYVYISYLIIFRKIY